MRIEKSMRIKSNKKKQFQLYSTNKQKGVCGMYKLTFIKIYNFYFVVNILQTVVKI